jgi:hypothetical protein
MNISYKKFNIALSNIFILVLLIGWCSVTYAQSRFETLPPKPNKWVKAFNVPTENPNGLIWDGKRILVIDSKSNTLLAVDKSGKVVDRYELKIKQPVAAGFFKNRLWMINYDSQFFEFDTNLQESKMQWEFYKLRMTDSIMQRPELNGLVGALATDDKTLWLSQIAGYGSSIFKINVENGLILSRFWSPGPDPTGLAWVGKELLILDGERMVVVPVDGTGKVVRQPFKTPSEKLRSLIYDGKYIYTLDVESKAVYRTVYP